MFSSVLRLSGDVIMGAIISEIGADAYCLGACLDSLQIVLRTRTTKSFVTFSKYKSHLALEEGIRNAYKL
jgi:hypothetical protein